MKNIEKYLHLEEVDHWELMNVLLRHFSQAENPSPFVTKYQAKNSPHGLWVTSNENGKIENIKFSDGFPKEQLKQIEQKIKDDLLTKEQATGAEVLFCPERITGYFKYKDFFQIIPVPDGSPMPIIGVKDYPFLVQFRYIKSSNMIIDYSRRREKATIYSRLLNLLLNQRVKLMRNNAQAYWIQAKKLVTGSGQPQFNANRIKELEIPLPSLIKQEEIVTRAEQLLIYSNNLKKEQTMLKELFESTLNKAMRGGLVN